MTDNYFVRLNSINVNDHTETKNNLTYLSWAWAWAEVKKLHPDAVYTVYEDANGCIYHTDGKTCWVKTGVTINGIEHIEYLPVMDFKNKSIPVGQVTSFDVNKSIQRSLTKACARHGLGLYIYAGEDLPEGEGAPAPKQQAKAASAEPASGAQKTEQQMAQTASEPIGVARAAALLRHLQKEGVDSDFVKKAYKVSSLQDLTEAQHSNIINNIAKIKEAQPK